MDLHTMVIRPTIQGSSLTISEDNAMAECTFCDDRGFLIEVTNLRRCPRCQGKGSVYLMDGPDPSCKSIYETCDSCLGRGKVESKKTYKYRESCPHCEKGRRRQRITALLEWFYPDYKYHRVSFWSIFGSIMLYVFVLLFIVVMFGDN